MTTMRCFPLLKTVLDEVWQQLPGSSDAEKVTAIRAKESYLREHYGKLSTGTVALDYADPATRYVYLCCYVTSHANIVADLIAQSEPLKTLFAQEKVQATCVGGGPGSDLLGVLKFLDGQSYKPRLKFFLYDREQAWSESWSDVDDKVGAEISTYFQPFDVADESTWKKNVKYLQSDLFTMIYFASEVHAIRDKAAPFFENLFQAAKSGAMFLYVDNASSVFFQWFDERFTGRGINVLASNDSAQLRLPNAEEKTDLGDHYHRIEGQPKITANVAYRVLRKA
ncbi:MAG: hypothetical protein U0174_03525 [Polyangiaceae bacterium]